jgi:hypothetical protein
MRAAAQSYVDSRVSLLCGTLAWSAHPLHGEPEEGTAAQSSTADLGKPRDTGSSTHCTCHRCLGTGTCAAGRNHARAFPARAKSYRARCRPYVGRRHGFSRSDTSDPGAAGCARARSIKRTATEGDLETMTSCTMSLRPTLPGRPSGSARRIAAGRRRADERGLTRIRLSIELSPIQGTGCGSQSYRGLQGSERNASTVARTRGGSRCARMREIDPG